MIDSAGQKLISICIPVLNEEGNIRPLYMRLCDVAEQLSDSYIFEFIFTDNNSEDLTWDNIQNFARIDSRVKGVRFTRNIGFQESILANLKLAKGSAMIQIDADLQDPPELIPHFLEKWEAGWKVVFGIRNERQESTSVNLVRKVGYRLISTFSNHPIPKDVGDFRLIDSTVRDELARCKTPKPYIRGMIAGFEIPSVGILYNREQRNIGKSKFPLRKVFALGFDGILNHSSLPLKFATMTGMFILLISFCLSLLFFLKIAKPNLATRFG